MDLQCTIKRACTVATAQMRFQYAIERGVARYCVMAGIRAGIHQAQMPGSLKSIALDHLDELSDEEKAAVEWAAGELLKRKRYERALGLAGKVVVA